MWTSGSWGRMGPQGPLRLLPESAVWLGGLGARTCPSPASFVRVPCPSRHPPRGVVGVGCTFYVDQGAWLTDRAAQAAPSPQGAHAGVLTAIAPPPCRAARQKKTMKLSRALSDLVKYTKSVGMRDVEAEGEGPGPGRGSGCAAARRASEAVPPPRSGVQLAGVVLQRDQGPADPAAEAGPVPPLQPAPALPHLPLPLPCGLQQLQPPALLERRLPDGCAGCTENREGPALQEAGLGQPRHTPPGPGTGVGS